MTVTTWHPVDNTWVRKDRPPRVGATATRAFRITSIRASVTPARNPRDDLTLGAYKPDATTTGVLPNTTLTVTTTHTPVSNTTYRNLDIRNTVSLLNKNNITYNNCIFRGPTDAATSSQALVRAWVTHGEGHTFTDCTFNPQTPNQYLDAIKGHGFTLRRCDISNTVDGIGVFNTGSPEAPCNVTVEQSFIHDNAYYPNPPDTSHTDGSHCDGLQWQSGPGLIFRGNNVIGRVGTQYQPGQFGTEHTNACLMLKPDVGTIGAATITLNWFTASNIAVNINDDAPDRYITDIGKISNNRFDHTQRGQGANTNDTWTILKPTATTGTFTGNVYDDTNTPVRIRTQ